MLAALKKTAFYNQVKTRKLSDFGLVESGIIQCYGDPVILGKGLQYVAAPISQLQYS